MSFVKYALSLMLLSSAGVTSGQQPQHLSESAYREQYRPQIHFSPAAHWMNDPNGMVYYQHVYHLFYQYYPGATVWGPMHWGHATSADMIHWKHQPVALYPDSLGYIFSGSAVVDVNNTSGFGRNGRVPLVAIFTQHDPKGEKAGKSDFQNQSIAYSLDAGSTWIKYAHNPVLKNPGIKDFRDPKVAWYEPGKRWVMTLAAQDRTTFYSSKDLKKWDRESEFGQTAGAHGGVWECPDLFPLTYNGTTVWILIVNINPGGPNGGSATQYFCGNFDGHNFVPFDTETRWVDYGPDEYAGVTWSNTGSRRLFLGWMSNWEYATVVPTVKWRSAMTVPRELSLDRQDDHYILRSEPVRELSRLSMGRKTISNLLIHHMNLAASFGKLQGPVRLQFRCDTLKSFAITLANSRHERLVVGYDERKQEFYIDRTASGTVGFEKGFGPRHVAPRLSTGIGSNMTLIIDVASIEVFADDGRSVMTAIFFPAEPYTYMRLDAPAPLRLETISYERLKSIWSRTSQQLSDRALPAEK